MIAAKNSLLAISLSLSMAASAASAQDLTVAELPFNADFSDLEAFSAELDGSQAITENDTLLLHVTGDEGEYLQFNAPAMIVSRDVFRIDPEKSYRISADVRTVQDDPTIEGTQGFIGVVTYDEDGKILTGGPGAHRYPTWTGQVLKRQLSGDWTSLEGVIQGEGNESHNQFREGTAYVRLVAILNYESPQGLSQIDNLRIEEVD